MLTTWSADSKSPQFTAENCSWWSVTLGEQEKKIAKLKIHKGPYRAFAQIVRFYNKKFMAKLGPGDALC